MNMSSQSPKKVIAAFDFDYTLVKTDSFQALLKQNFGIVKFSLSIILYFFYILLFLVKIVKPQTLKRKFFSHFFKGMNEKKYKEKCSNFSFDFIPEHLIEDAKKKLEWHKKQGHTLVIISASLEDWIKPWAIQNGFNEVFATIPEVKNGKITGNFKSKNCRWQEKVNRLINTYPDRDSYYLYAYGDSSGDKELLEFADESFYRKYE